MLLTSSAKPDNDLIKFFFTLNNFNINFVYWHAVNNVKISLRLSQRFTLIMSNTDNEGDVLNCFAEAINTAGEKNAKLKEALLLITGTELSQKEKENLQEILDEASFAVTEMLKEEQKIRLIQVKQVTSVRLRLGYNKLEAEMQNIIRELNNMRSTVIDLMCHKDNINRSLSSSPLVLNRKNIVSTPVSDNVVVVIEPEKNHFYDIRHDLESVSIVNTHILRRLILSMNFIDSSNNRLPTLLISKILPC